MLGSKEKHCSINDRLDKTPHIAITKGVSKQTLWMMEMILENIARRGKSYLFTEFNRILPDNLRDSGRGIFLALTDYKEAMEGLQSKICCEIYLPPKQEPYFILLNYVRALHDKFFSIGKENHKYDFNTDEYITVSALYQALSAEDHVDIFSNDGDIAQLLGASFVVLQSLEPLTRKYPRFHHFYANPPQLYRVAADDASLTKIDITAVGNSVISNYAGFDLSQQMSDTRKNEYYQMVNAFTGFLQRTTSELIESLEEKA